MLNFLFLQQYSLWPKNLIMPNHHHVEQCQTSKRYYMRSQLPPLQLLFTRNQNNAQEDIEEEEKFSKTNQSVLTTEKHSPHVTMSRI